MLERLRRMRAVSPAYIVPLLIIVALAVYSFAHEFILKFAAQKNASLGESCPDPSVKQENPNTTLFVNCGGYLE